MGFGHKGGDAAGCGESQAKGKSKTGGGSENMSHDGLQIRRAYEARAEDCCFCGAIQHFLALTLWLTERFGQ